MGEHCCGKKDKESKTETVIRKHEVKSGQSRYGCEWGDGYSDNFVPLEPLDLSKVKTVNDLVTAMGKTACGGRTVGEGADVLFTMSNDPDSFNVLTLSGIMTVAKMSPIMCEMIERGMIHAVISTGALMAHGFIEGSGMKHFKYQLGQMDDKELYYAGYDRIYDTLELESNMDKAEELMKEVFNSISDDTILSSRILTYKLGKFLSEKKMGRSVLRSAYENNVPVYIPAFTDSEMGLDLGVTNRKRMLDGKQPLVFNPFFDLEHYTEVILKQKNLGIFTIGGGVPRNWAQQVGPYCDIINARLFKGTGVESKELDKRYFKRFKYAVRICPEPVYWGGLSGCTYSEGVSWGKFIPADEGGMHSEVMSDATIAWPLIAKAVFERLDEKKIKIKKNFDQARFMMPRPD